MKLNCLKSFLGLALLAVGLAMPNVAFADTLEKNPSGYDSNNSTTNVSNVARAYYGTTHTNQYATISTNYNTNSQYLYLTFDLSSIPSNATITGVSCSVRTQKTADTGTLDLALCNGTTVNGAATTVAYSSSSAVTSIANTGSWTAANIQNLQLRVGIARSYWGTDVRARVYGADLTITYTVPLTAPTFSPAGGQFIGRQSVAISTVSTGATIHYTIDGTTPTAESATYSAPVVLQATTTIKAIAVKEGETSSSVSEATYELIKPKAVEGYDVNLVVGKTATPFSVYNTTLGQYKGVVRYSSNDESIATVAADGTITAVAEGETTVTATPGSFFGYDLTAVTINVTVSNSKAPAVYSTSWTAGQTVYLYNKESGLYLGTGGYWGTEGYLKTTGVPTVLATASAGTTTTTTMTQNSKSWGYVTSAMITAQEKWGLYCDVSDDETYSGYTHSFKFVLLGDGEFSIESVLKTSAEADGSSYYLAMKNDGTGRANVVTAKAYTGTIPDEARWYIVTYEDLVAEFEKATASDARPKEATFFLKNTDFSREVAQSWTLTAQTGASSNTTGVGSYTGGFARIGNSLFNTGGPNTSINNSGNYIEAEGAAITSGTSYDGNGGKYTLTDADMNYVDNTIFSSGSSTFYNIPYGGFYNCRILGKTGSVKQSFVVDRTGWYRVYLDGYIYNPSGATGKATIYAGLQGATTLGKNYAEGELKENPTYETMTQAGITLATDTEKKWRSDYLLVYMEKNQTFEVGVKLTDGTLSTDGIFSKSTFVELDNVKLQYTGDANDLVLSELDYNTKTYKDAANKEYNYIDAQVSDKSRTLVFQRQIHAGYWNSLVMPVNISVSALKTAFGEDVQLGEFDTTIGHTIYFKSVDLSDDDANAITAGNFYIVKPSSASSASTSGNYNTKLALTGDEYPVTATNAAPVFLFQQVYMPSVPVAGNNFDTVIQPKETDLEWSDAKMTMFGSYFAKVGAIPQYSYAIASGGHDKDSDVNKNYAGNWVHYVGKNSLDVLGFRCWIAPTDLSPMTIQQASKVNITFALDGIEDEATDIVGVTDTANAIINNKVYTVNGQMVSANGADLNSLPKGIYIVNGKKYVVK